MGMQVPCILVVSHVFNVVFRTVGQPGSIGQVLAGLVLGPMSHIEYIQATFFPACSINYYEVVSFFCRIHFMFLFGLEMNIHYTMRNLCMVSLVACGGAIWVVFLVYPSHFTCIKSLTPLTMPPCIIFV
ncbi:hypothetical protein JHK87_023543 [Glycine soja]|nr:hypothetical protein JHK87_023543 [Glycine soja]